MYRARMITLFGGNFRQVDVGGTPFAFWSW
jgi:hypothetical protein